MVILSLKPKVPENYIVFCSASQSNKLNPRDRALDSPSFFRYKHITFHLHRMNVCRTGFGATVETVFVLINQLREFSLSAVTNHCELRNQLKQVLLLHYKSALVSWRK